MAQPGDLKEEVDAYETNGRSGGASAGEDADFDFGPFKVRSVERNLTIEKGFTELEGFEARKNRGFRFQLAAGKKKLRGQCNERKPTVTKDIDGSVSVEKSAPSLACVCADAGNTVAQFYVEDLAGQYGGPLLIGEASARIVGGYKLEDGERLEGRPAGYMIEDGEGAVIAAAGILPGESKVWIQKGLEESDRNTLVCSLVGLMLWVPPAESPSGDG